MTCASLNFLSSDWAATMLIGTGTLSIVSATHYFSIDVLQSARLPPINCQNEDSLLSASFCWACDSCHWTLDWFLVSLSELSLFLRLPRIIFLVRCRVSVTSSSSDSSFVFESDRFHFGPRMLSSLSSFLHSCGISDH